MKHNTVKVAALAFAAFATTAAIAACSDSTGPAAPAAVTAQSATTISAQAGAGVEAPTVVVTGAGGGPAAGVPVTFTVTAGGGTVANTSVLTNASGVATAGTWFLGPVPGVNTVTASVAGVPPVTFTATSTLGPAAQVIRIAGEGQAGLPGVTLPTPLTARVLDAIGNPVAGATVTFTVETGGGSIAGATATTNAAGNATSGLWTLGPASGNQTVRASSGTGSVIFTAIGHDPCDDRVTIAVGGTADGTLATGDCVLAGALADRFSVTTTANQAVNITLSSTAFPTRLHVHNAAGTTEIATNPGGSGSALIKLLAAATTKTISATTSSTTGAGAYTLAVDTTSASVEDCEEVFIEIGVTTQQSISDSDCQTDAPWRDDLFRIFLTAGQTIRIQHTADYAVWTEVRGPALSQLRMSNGAGDNQFTAPSTGYFFISATTSSSTTRGPYALQVTTP